MPACRLAGFEALPAHQRRASLKEDLLTHRKSDCAASGVWYATSEIALETPVADFVLPRRGRCKPRTHPLKGQTHPAILDRGTQPVAANARRPFMAAAGSTTCA